MNAQDFKRKLTAVFSADVAGYSRLMGEDEASTVKTRGLELIMALALIWLGSQGAGRGGYGVARGVR
jgi:hypothetical protein